MKEPKKTKIVATIGPATENARTLEQLVDAGMNVMRLNFSHGDSREHQKRVDIFRAIAQKKNIPLAILQDLSGPKIRIGDFSTDTITLVKGHTFTLTTKKIIGDEKHVYVNYKTLPQELTKGSQILLDDGKKRLEVIKTTKTDVVCKVRVGGVIKGRRGVNLPGAYLKVSSLTTKDKKDLAFGIKNNVEFIALSFVRRAEDITKLRRILIQKQSRALIIAKIETEEAIENLDAIINEADGVMVARGDLAIEVPAQKVPIIQKQIIQKCNQLGKPVITATQMLSSMMTSPVPTRAEVSDIANAILDGTDAIMLSEETTLSEYAKEAVEVMYHTAEEVEHYQYGDVLMFNGDDGHVGVVDVVTHAVAHAAEGIGAKAIIALTASGFTARMIARHKPQAPIFALSPDPVTCNQLALSYGCEAYQTERLKTLDERLKMVRAFLRTRKEFKKGDRVVVSAGMPLSSTRVETNMFFIENIE